MKTKVPEPNFQTGDEQLNKVEQAKLNPNGLRGDLYEEFRDHEASDIQAQSEQLAKSHGIYLEYNRAVTGHEKDWSYMVRVSVSGGGPLNRQQWQIFDELSERYGADPEGRGSLRCTTRQNIQFHWVKKPHVIELVRRIAETSYFTINGCGDNVRNVMGCPLSRFSDIYDANALAHKFGAYFRLPAEPHIQVFAIDPNYIRTPDEQFQYGKKLLNRKFKIAFSAVHRDEQTGGWQHDNCVELRTNEVGVAPIVENDQVAGYQVYIGGGQGEKNGKPTFAQLGQPFGVFADEQELLKGIDSIVHVQQDWGDRQNRHWARMKYLVQAKGVGWFQDQVRGLGASFELPLADFDPGPRMLHHGWQKQPSNGKLAYGAYVENGRIMDGDNGQLKSMVRHLVDQYDLGVMITPNQDLLFTDIEPEAKERFEADLAKFGHGQRGGKAVSRLRVLSGACVGLYTCRLAYTESEQFEPQLLEELEEQGYGEMHESIGITGCERQCYRPATKSIGWIGQGPNMYGLKIGGSEDGSTQGFWLSDGEKWYLRRVPREAVGKVTGVLFDYYMENRESEAEQMGAFHQRVGRGVVIEYLKSHAQTAGLMEKTSPAPYDPKAAEGA